MNSSIETTAHYYLRLQRKLKVANITSAVVVVCLAIVILVGHIINSPFLIRFPFSVSGMNPMVAINFFVAGIALLFYTIRAGAFNTMLLLRIAGWFLIVQGLVRFSELAGIYDPQLDLLLFSDRFIHTETGQIRGRMSYTSSLLFILTGIVFLIKTQVPAKQKIVQYLLFAIVIFSSFTLISIIYGVSNSYFGPMMVLKMSLSSSACFLLISLALLTGDYKTGAMAILTSNKEGGRVARLFLPFVLILPLLLGIVDRVAEASGLFQDSLGLALVSLITMTLFFIFIIRTAKSNNITYDRLLKEIEERKKAVGEAYDADLFASAIYDNIPNMVFVKDGEDLRFRSMNRAGEELTGTTREELLGRSDYDFFPKEEADFFKARDKEVFATNKPIIVEEPITTRHNGLRWLRTKKIGVKDKDGKPLYMIGISEDITELKEKQEQLNQYYTELEEKVKERTQELDKSERRFHAIIQSAPDAMIISDENELIQLVNTQTEKLFGYTREELIGSPINLLIPDTALQKYGSSQDKYRGIGAGQDLFGRTKNGKKIPVEISLSPIQTLEGTLISVSIRDITQRKKAEKILVENELMFRDLTQNVPGVIYQWVEKPDGSRFFRYVSPKLKQYFGLAPEEMDKIAEYIHPEDKAAWQTSINAANENGTPWFFEGRLLYPDGTIKWWRGSSVMSLKNEEGRIYNGIMIDITEQKQIEEKIASSQKRFEAIFNSQYQFMGVMTPDGILIEVNETALNFAGLQSSDVIGKPFWECFWWTISESAKLQLKQAIPKAARGEFIRYETDVLGKGAVIATIDFSIKPVFDDNGEVILLISEGRDVTQKKLLEQKSREQEEQIRLFVRHTPAAIAMFDDNMRYMVVSDRWYKDYGLVGENIIGKSHYEIFPEISDMPEWKAIHKHSLAGSVIVREQDPFPRKDGSMHWLRWELHPWKTSNNKIGGLIMFTEDITGRMKAQDNLKKLNQQLTESNKELEQFAYVASHDLQEPLRMVSSFLQLLEKKYRSQLDEAALQYIHFAVDGSDRMKTLINDLLRFSRVGTSTDEIVPVDCNDIVANVIKVYDQKIRENNAIVEISGLPVVKANKTQVEQLFQNLIGNALKYRGKETPHIEVGCEEDEALWRFYVKDNGIGIDPRFYDKVFVIFQRLHGKGEYGGTGIGLAICKKIVERHGGKIWIESVLEKGSVFYFSMPKS